MDEVWKMTPKEELKNWWLRHGDEVTGCVTLGAVVFVTVKLSYKFGYIRGVRDLANALGDLVTQNNS